MKLTVVLGLISFLSGGLIINFWEDKHFLSVAVICATLSAASTATCTPTFRFVDPSVSPASTADVFTDQFGDVTVDVTSFAGRILNVEATYPCATQPRCVEMYFDGKLRNKPKPPFNMFHNAPRNMPGVIGREISTGYHTLKACAFNSTNCRIAPLGCEEVEVYVFDQCANQVNFFQFIDPGNGDAAVGSIDPSTISLSDFTDYGKLNVEVYATGTSGNRHL